MHSSTFIPSNTTCRRWKSATERLRRMRASSCCKLFTHRVTPSASCLETGLPAGEVETAEREKKRTRKHAARHGQPAGYKPTTHIRRTGNRERDRTFPMQPGIHILQFARAALDEVHRGGRNLLRGLRFVLGPLRAVFAAPSGTLWCFLCFLCFSHGANGMFRRSVGTRRDGRGEKATPEPHMAHVLPASGCVRVQCWLRPSSGVSLDDLRPECHKNHVAQRSITFCHAHANLARRKPRTEPCCPFWVISGPSLLENAASGCWRG